MLFMPKVNVYINLHGTTVAELTLKLCVSKIVVWLPAFFCNFLHIFFCSQLLVLAYRVCCSCVNSLAGKRSIKSVLKHGNFLLNRFFFCLVQLAAREEKKHETFIVRYEDRCGHAVCVQ